MAKRQPGLFDAEFRLRKIDSLGDPLQKLDQVIDWEIFRGTLNNVFASHEDPKGPGGRPPYDYLLRFKVLILQSLYNLSDDAMEFQLNDRRTFQRFVGLEEKDPSPDAKSIWAWREILTTRKKFKTLFMRFWRYLEESGIKAQGGSIIDASFMDAPRQHNSKEENEGIKNGEMPEEWKKPENTAMRRQKDVDARWAKKRDEMHFGYKNHVKVDAKTKLIKAQVVTDASVHDSKVLEKLLDSTDADRTVHADSAYYGAPQFSTFEKVGAIPKVNAKGYRNAPLTRAQKRQNRSYSRVRARVEHVFGCMTKSMGGMLIRCIGLVRAEAVIIMKNLAYNMKRYSVLVAP